jgi:hypothetical protein
VNEPGANGVRPDASPPVSASGLASGRDGDAARRAREATVALRTLRRTIVRLGVPGAARYWRTPWAVFASNLAGGAAVGAIAFILAGLFVGLDVHRGDNSLVVRVLRAAQHDVAVVRSMVEETVR